MRTKPLFCGDRCFSWLRVELAQSALRSRRAHSHKSCAIGASAIAAVQSHQPPQLQLSRHRHVCGEPRRATAHDRVHVLIRDTAGLGELGDRDLVRHRVQKLTFVQSMRDSRAMVSRLSRATPPRAWLAMTSRTACMRPAMRIAAARAGITVP